MNRVIMLLICAMMFAGSAMSAGKNGLDEYRGIYKRNIFKPLWKSTRKTPEELAAERRRKEEERRKQQQQRQEESAVAKKQRELDMEEKKLRSTVLLTGIVDDGTQVLAFFNNKRKGNTTITVKSGDMLAGWAVREINDATSTVTLEYQDERTVVLSLEE